MDCKKIAVLKGGMSSEREVSLNSAAAVSKVLTECGYEVIEIDVGKDVAEQLAFVRPDVVFNALHGTYGEDGCIQGLLEIMQIPYTHSGVMASAIAMDKPTAKILFETVGIRCAPGQVVSSQELKSGVEILNCPVVIKPTNDGSSVGVHIIDEISELANFDYQAEKRYLIEKFIAGRELTVGMIGDRVTEVCEIKPKDGFYDYSNKYKSHETQYIIPADIPKNIAEEAKEFAIKAHRILGCRGISRSDIRYGEDGKIYMLETNTHPGMTATSLIPKLAKNMGITFNELMQLLIDNAKLDKDS